MIVVTIDNKNFGFENVNCVFVRISNLVGVYNFAVIQTYFCDVVGFLKHDAISFWDKGRVAHELPKIGVATRRMDWRESHMHGFFYSGYRGHRQILVFIFKKPLCICFITINTHSEPR